MPSKLDQLKRWTIVDRRHRRYRGDPRLFANRIARPIRRSSLKAAQMEAYSALVEEAIFGASIIMRRRAGSPMRLAVNFGAELTKIVPGRVSTEVDADLSFDVEGTVAQAREIIEDYVERGVRRERVLVKIAATWEGIKAASILQKEGIDCNLTLIFSLAQAAACRRCRRLSHLALRRPHPRLARQDRGQDLYGRDRSRGCLGASRSMPIIKPMKSRPSSWAPRSAIRARSRRWPAATA